MTKGFDTQAVLDLLGKDTLFVSKQYSPENPDQPVLLNRRQYLEAQYEEACKQLDELRGGPPPKIYISEEELADHQRKMKLLGEILANDVGTSTSEEMNRKICSVLGLKYK